ncbi:MAG TPA: hypothetical protein VLK58_26160, partial [Conexibacter sp.]|nr:hypothetical protein [Conexibacter sp.]
MPRSLRCGRSMVALLTLLPACAAPLALAGGANAAVAAAAITAPSPVAIYPTYDQDSVATFPVAGSATGGGPMRVYCDSVNPNGSVRASIALSGLVTVSGGAFSVPIRPSAVEGGVVGCRLQPRPSDGLPDDMSPFTGPLMFRQTDLRRSLESGASAGLQTVYEAQMNQRRSAALLTGAAWCGLCGLAPNEDERAAEWSWWETSWLDGYFTDEARTAALVDGRETFFPGTVEDPAFDGYAGHPAISGEQLTPVSASGPGRLSASETPVHCSTDPVPTEDGGDSYLDPASCAAFVPTGVRFDRSYAPLDDSGRSWRVTDVVHSVDGRAHTLDLAYANHPGNLEEPRIAVPWAAQPGFRPWSDSFGPLGAPPSLPATIYTQYNATRPVGFQNPVGALTVGAGFVGAELAVSDRGTVITTRYRRTVPANGAVTIEQTATAALDEGEARARAAEAERVMVEPPAPPTPEPPAPNPPTPTPPAPPAPTPPAGDTSRPLLSQLTRTKTGFRVRLSEPARITITIARRDAGRRAGKACKRSTRRLRGAKRCTRLTRIGAIAATGRAGVNAIAFENRVGRR